MHLEGPYINPEYLGAQNPNGVRLPDMEEIKELNYIIKISLISLASDVDGGLPVAPFCFIRHFVM